MVVYQVLSIGCGRKSNNFSKDFSEKMTQTEIPLGEISQSELKTIPKVAGFEGVR